MVAETTLCPDHLIAPLFVRHGKDQQTPIVSIPGHFQFTVDRIVNEARRLRTLGIPAVLLFGIPEQKDPLGSENARPEGIVPTAIRAIKDAVPELVVISDMCLCEYTDHGHCGAINPPAGTRGHDPRLPPGYLLNDRTLELLAEASAVHASAGADIIAPSGMIDGMVGAIRKALDESGYQHVAVMSYSVKYASGFYGPFRQAAESAPAFGDRRQYQMDPANAREAFREAALDIAEGADILMVKPAMPSLDVICSLRRRFNWPVAAYQVSGEYAMLHAAAANGWLDLKSCALESLTSIRRAGADLIISYFAADAARWLERRSVE
ncbi:MAG: porphobilinogen synthase [Phycisphaerales bacterium]|nr:porphobilinogen synthase [Phycisphaerales bacterium]